MNVHPDVNFEELARSTDDFNGAQLKAVCVEAGMLALRRDATEVLLSLSLCLSCTLFLNQHMSVLFSPQASLAALSLFLLYALNHEVF